jgi:CRISPR-associated protein Cmr1
LTPLWTGNADKRCDQIRETGLRGSLRWWYEAMLRGSGFYACDPSCGTCVYEVNKGLASICLACQLFGCTGYSSRVRIEVEGGSGAGELKELRLSNPGNQPHRGWRIPPTCTASFRLKIVPLFRIGVDTEGLALTLRLIEKYGAFGAKTSHGQGVVKFQNVPPAIQQEWPGQLRQHLGTDGRGGPRLSDLVGAIVRMDGLGDRWWQSLPLREGDLRGFNLSAQSSWLPTSPVIRGMLRAGLRQRVGTNDRHRIMGTIQGWGDPDPKKRTKGSDVHVTHAYRSGAGWEMRIFAFVPNTNNTGNVAIRTALANGDHLAQEIRSALKLGSGPSVTAEPYPEPVPTLLSTLGRA